MKTLTIVGVGALGSHLVQFIRNLDVKIKVIDFDRVEQKNTMSQFYGKPSVGKNKANALQAQLQFLYGVKIEAIPHKLTADNLELLDNSDLVIDCLDNSKSRLLVKKYCENNNIECVHAGVDQDNSFGRVGWTDFTIDVEGKEGGATCENGEHLTHLAAVATLLAESVGRFLKTGEKIAWVKNPGGIFKVKA